MPSPAELGLTELPDKTLISQVSTTTRRWVDDFGGAALDPALWDFADIIPGITHVVANSTLVVSMGTTANAERHYLSKASFTIPFDVYVGLRLSQRILDNNVWVEIVEVDADGNPKPHATVAGEMRNRAGVGYVTSATAAAAQIEATCDDSPNGANLVTTTSWASTIADHDVHLEYRIADTWASNVTMDTASARSSTALRLSRQVPDPNGVYKVRVRVKNGATPPATNTDLTLYRVAIADVQELLVELASGRGDAVAGRAVGVNVVGTAAAAGSTADNSSTVPNPQLVSGLMSSAVGGPAAGTTARQGSMQSDLARRQIVRQLGNPQSHDPGRAVLTTTTETTLVAAVALLRNELQSVTVVNRDNVVHTVDIRDALAGTVRESVTVPANDTRQLNFPAGRPSAAVNTALTVQMRETATTAVEVTTSSFKTSA